MGDGEGEGQVLQDRRGEEAAHLQLTAPPERPCQPMPWKAVGSAFPSGHKMSAPSHGGIILATQPFQNWWGGGGQDTPGNLSASPPPLPLPAGGRLTYRDTRAHFRREADPRTMAPTRGSQHQGHPPEAIKSSVRENRCPQNDQLESANVENAPV